MLSRAWWTAVLFWAALVPAPVRSATAASDTWGDYAAVVGKSARGSGGGFTLRWSWAEPGKTLVQEYVNPGSGSVSHSEVITLGAEPGTFLLQSSALAKKRWIGRLQGDGSVLFIGTGFLKLPYVAGLGADGNWELRRVKLDGERIASMVDPEKYSRFLIEDKTDGVPTGKPDSGASAVAVAKEPAPAAIVQDAIAVGAPVQITIPADATSDEGSFGTRCLRIDLKAGQGYAFNATTPSGADRFVALSQYRQPDCKTGILNDDYSRSGRLTFKFRSSGGGSYFMLVRAHAGPIELSLEKIEGWLAVQRIGTGLPARTTALAAQEPATASGTREATPLPGPTTSPIAMSLEQQPASAATSVETLDPQKWGMLARISGHQGYSATWKGIITYLPSADGNALYELLQAGDVITLIGQFQRDPATGAVHYVNNNQYRDYRSFQVFPVDGSSVRMESISYPAFAWDSWLLLDGGGFLRRGFIKRTLDNLDGASPYQLNEARHGRRDSPIALNAVDVAEVRASTPFREAVVRADASRSQALSDVAYAKGLLAAAAAHNAERDRRRAANARWDAVMRPLYGALSQAAAEQTVQTQKTQDRLDQTLAAIRAESARRDAVRSTAPAAGVVEATRVTEKRAASQTVQPASRAADASHALAVRNQEEAQRQARLEEQRAAALVQAVPQSGPSGQSGFPGAASTTRQCARTYPQIIPQSTPYIVGQRAEAEARLRGYSAPACIGGGGGRFGETECVNAQGMWSCQRRYTCDVPRCSAESAEGSAQ